MKLPNGNNSAYIRWTVILFTIGAAYGGIKADLITIKKNQEELSMKLDNHLVWANERNTELTSRVRALEAAQVFIPWKHRP